MNPEIIRASTPIFIAAIGGFIGIAVLVSPGKAEKWSAGMGLAGTAIAGAAGLAQSTKSESNVAVEAGGKKIKAGDSETA
ncbi:MAG: hypothetical protein ACRDEA_08210 [Microcystaceae cyanobacterium]